MERASSFASAVMVIGLATLATPDARAQTADMINGLRVFPFNIQAGANSTLTITDTAGQPPNPPTPTSLPLAGGAIIDERNYAPFNAANRHDLQLSSNGGTSAAPFDFQNEGIDVSMDVTLTAGVTAAPRKEAGFIFSSPMGSGQFIVNTDAHEIAAFGGPFIFHQFKTATYQFNSGDTANLRIIYQPPPRDMGGTIIGDGTIEYRVKLNGGAEQIAGPFPIDNDESGLFTNTTVAAYAQAAGANAGDFITARFENFDVSAPPEPVDGDADFDEDGDVDGQDFLVWQRGLGSSGVGLGMGDATGDTNVDADDLAVWKAQFGDLGAPVATVPEPASLFLAGGAALLFGVRRRKANMS
jgi:hypothetical protein